VKYRKCSRPEQTQKCEAGHGKL